MLGNVSRADDIHLCATAAACAGNASSAQITNSTTAFVYGKTYNPVPDTLYVAVLTPMADNSGNWNSSSSTLAQVLGEAPSQTFPTLASAICNLEGGAGCGPTTGFSAMSFNVTDFPVNSLNPWSTGVSDTNPLSFTLPGSPAAGDMYIAFLEDANGNLVAVSPWSSSLIYAPEPGTLSLLLVGVLGLAVFFGRRLCAS
jgi:hypothetical protein